MSDEPQSLRFSPEAEWAFACHVADVEAGRGKDFEALCGEHPELADELRGLKAQWEQVAGIMQHLLQEPSVASARPQASAAIGAGSDGQPAAGDELVHQLAEHSPPASRYELRGEFARGGMGEIHRVWDKDLRRELAMKLIRSKESPGSTLAVNELALARFLDEAQVTGQLDHPGVVPVHELGLDASGRVYFTMRLVKGRNLGEVLELMRARKDGWTRTRVLGVLLRVCEAMAYAHSKGVVHRDLKPSNVMVGRFGEVYVMDWGLARVIGRKDSHDLRLRTPVSTGTLRTARRERAAETPDSPIVTMDGTVVGTPSYMPPEQAEGRVEELGPAADVYALGSILYELLAGQKPYVRAGSHPSPHTILAALLQGPPTRIEELVRDVPAELVAICERAMTRDPARRYRDMAALAEDLSAYLEHRVVTAYRTGAVAELRKWVERNRKLAASLAAVLVAVVGGLVVSLVFKARSDRNAVLAQENALIAGENERLARHEKERAEASEKRALEGERAATERADDVFRLSALQKLDDLIEEADRLWPAHPENLTKCDEWLRKARELVAELPDHERKLAELRAKSVPWTEQAQAKHRAEHPKLAELETAKRHREHHAKLRAALESGEPRPDPTPAEVGVDVASLPATANGVNELGWPLVDPDRKDWGGEAKGLVLSQRAVELAAAVSRAERAGIRNTLSWALFGNGRFDEAVAEQETALEEAPAERKDEFRGYLDRLEKKIEEEIDPEKEERRAKHMAQIEERIATLEAEISQRPEWQFADAQDKWWHNQLEKLVEGLKAFSDSEKGLASSGISAEHGWHVEKRAEFARTIAERSVSGSEASEKWAEAVASVADAAECPLYCGLRITPQLGLLPIGRDRESGLWEFAHLQTGDPAERGSDGKLILKESTGLVLVLLPGGPFQMGAQADDPAGANYDPQADPNEGPVHAVTLSPFFLSKYEMTQGQWKSFVGSNPSYYAAEPPKPPLHPLEQVSWTSCEQELGRLGLRLPSEAQWEYGCRAGTNTPWSTGGTLESLRGFANIADEGSANQWPKGWIFEPGFADGWPIHCPVGTLRPNALGLHEMHGNVWEWCEDGYQGDFYRAVSKRDPVSDPAGSAYRVVRGGGLGTLAVLARSAYRGPIAPSNAGLYLGLRPARALLP